MMYLLIFGVGTIAGMMLVPAAVAAPITYSANRFRAFNRYVERSRGHAQLNFRNLPCLSNRLCGRPVSLGVKAISGRDGSPSVSLATPTFKLVAGKRLLYQPTHGNDGNGVRRHRPRDKE